MRLFGARKIWETLGPTLLSIGGIGDGQMLMRSGTTVIGTGIAPPKEQTFNATTSGAWQHYTIPEGHTHLEIDIIGAGAGGGNGQVDADGVTRRGGGGGGSGQHVNWIGRVPAGVTQLSIQVGLGGQGGWGTLPGAIGDGQPGETTTVSVQDSTNSEYRIINSGNVPSRGGQAGLNGGLGGAGEQAPTTAHRFGAEWGQFNAGGSQAGANGGLGAAGGNITPTSIARTGGAGGGGRNASNTSFAGGNVSASGTMALVQGGAIQGGDGSSGVDEASPETHTGGAGGAGSDTEGGNGGHGAIGCGGGGGGAGTTGTALGGNGGNARVRIRTW